MTTWRFDRAKADRVIRFFERCLVHSKGEWAGQPFVLAPWQREIVERVFGEVGSDGLRRYRTVYIEVPRKNGKSTFCAGLGVYLALADGEPGAEVFAAAVDREQAEVVFDEAKRMVQASSTLKAKCRIFKRSIVIQKTMSAFRVLSADSSTKHGLNVHGVLVDELHAHRNRDLWDVLVTGRGSRRQPLAVAITTAGSDRHGVCWELHEKARRIRAGEIEDPSFYGVIYAAAVGDDWRSEATWRTANPGYGISVQAQYLADECAAASQSAAYENAFRRLHLNQWTQQDVRYLPMARWDECAGTVDLAALEGQPCYGGLDLSSTLDVTAWVKLFPRPGGTLVVIPRFFLPSAHLGDRCRRDGVPYDQWARQGLVTLIDGEMIDYAWVREQIQADAERFDVREVAYDRWGAAQLVQELEGAGMIVVQMGQGFASMSGPTKELLSLVMARRLIHGGNPMLRWMADCLEVRSDPAGNLKPSKPDRRMNSNRIDGIVALIMALDRAMRHAGNMAAAAKLVSVYETRGLVSV